MLDRRQVWTMIFRSGTCANFARKYGQSSDSKNQKLSEFFVAS